MNVDNEALRPLVLRNKKGAWNYMLENMVVVGLVSQTQNELFDLFARRNDTDGLARLAMLEDLDDSVDAKLAGVSSGSVRAKWLSRPGRGETEVYENIRREKRVGVLVELLAIDLRPDTYTVIAKANKSHTLALAVLGSEKAPKEAKDIAAGNLGKYVTEKTKSSKLFAIKEALTNNPKQFPAFTKEASCWQAVEIALVGGPYAGDLAVRVGSALLREVEATSQAVEQASQKYLEAKNSGSYVYSSYRYDTERRLRSVLNTLINADTSWLSASTKNESVSLLQKMEMDVTKSWGSSGLDFTSAITAIQSEDRQKKLSDMVAKVRNAKDRDSLIVSLAGCSTFQGTTRDQLAAAILRNDTLSYRDMDAGLHFMQGNGGGIANAWLLINDMGKSLYTSYPINGVLMCKSLSPWRVDIEQIRKAGREQEFVDAAIAVMREGEIPHPAIINDLLESSLLTVGTLAEMPCALLSARSEDFSPQVRSMFGELLARELGDLPAVGLEQFERLVSKFNGTVAELAKVCKAATAA